MKLKSALNRILNKNRITKKNFYPLNSNNLRNRDLIEGVKVILSRQLTMSNKTFKFENYFKKKMNFKNAIMVNSGSSANLLAFQCLINPYRKNRLKPGDEILIPALCWSTSLWPIIQSGMKPVFVDIDLDTLNISIKDLISKINKKTKAIMLVHVLGNCTNMEELMKIKKKHRLILIEDTCESLGSKYKDKNLGSFGEFSTFSFYFSHQINSIEGGMICSQSNNDAEIIKSLRSHGYARGLKNQKKIEKSNKHINKKFLFINSGFNFRPTEIQAAIGFSQFKSLKNFVKQRRYNRKKIILALKKDNRWWNQVHFVKQAENVKASWFGVPMIMNKRYKYKKRYILNKMDALGIETRPIISGNFVKQPSVKKYKLVKGGQAFPNVDIVHKLGFFIGLSSKSISDDNIKNFKNNFFKSFN